MQKTAPRSNRVPHAKYTLRTTAEHQAEQSPRNTGQVATHGSFPGTSSYLPKAFSLSACSLFLTFHSLAQRLLCVCAHSITAAREEGLGAKSFLNKNFMLRLEQENNRKKQPETIQKTQTNQSSFVSKGCFLFLFFFKQI